MLMTGTTKAQNFMLMKGINQNTEAIKGIA